MPWLRARSVHHDWQVPTVLHLPTVNKLYQKWFRQSRPRVCCGHQLLPSTLITIAFVLLSFLPKKFTSLPFSSPVPEGIHVSS